MHHGRRTFLKVSALAAAAPGFASAQSTEAKEAIPFQNLPSMVEADGQLRFDFGKEHMVLPSGLQPSLLCTAKGTLVAQGQMPEKPVETPRMHYPSAMGTVISRDAGQTWTRIPLAPGSNGVNLEGGMVQLRNGTILALDTYIVPGSRPDQGTGQLYTSTDDWRTLSGPQDVVFELPGIDFFSSTDDGGRPYAAARLHRRILEMPNGDLLTTIYGIVKGDKTPAAYRPTMMRTRVLLARSTDRGQHWSLVSTVAVNPAVGTEGFGEAVLAHANGPQGKGRLLCFMRTGRDLYEATSEDEGKTWSTARPRIFAGLDIHRTELWVDMFRNVRGRTGRMLDENNPDELQGSVVDPDLIQMRDGTLAAAFGIRIPQQLCWPNFQHPWNGNYLAFSQDRGNTWSNVVRITSAVPTTHYMAIEETPNAGELFVTYDLGFWNHSTRYICGRTVRVTKKDGANHSKQ